MAWIILCAAAWLAALLLIPKDSFRRLWPAGIISMLVLYFIDTTLIRLGAFSYNGSPFFSDIPVFYWTSSFPGGLLLAYFYPAVKRLRLPYVAGAAAVFLVLELIMKRLGYINYLNWNTLYSFFLDVGGFIIVLWLSRVLDSTGKNKSPIEGDL